jgi:hypothetical protein
LGAGQKKARRRAAWVVFEDESGISERPPVRRTWAPHGTTPEICHPFRWKKLSIACAIGYRPGSGSARLCFHIVADSYNDTRLIEFLANLNRHSAGQPVILTWDGLASHRSRIMSGFLATQRHWLEVVRLPGNAPELNPVDSLWGNIRGQELANRSVDGLGEMVRGVHDGFRRIRSQRFLLRSFLQHAGLSLP